MTYYLNGKNFTDKEKSYNYLKEQLQLPEYTGHNLDALWDIFYDMDPMEIEIIHGRNILENLGDYGKKLLDLFGDLDQKTCHKVTIRW